MERKNQKPERGNQFDLDALLDPAQAFAHPADVVNDQDLTLNEKRAILASWASDASAIEAVSTLRSLPDRAAITLDDIMDALRTIDRQTGAYKPRPHYRRVLSQRIPGVFGRKDRDSDRGQAA